MQVEEQHVSGAVNLHYFHTPAASAYQGLGNVMLRLQPRGYQASGNRTVLLNAHYDSTIGSQGLLSAFRLDYGLELALRQHHSVSRSAYCLYTSNLCCNRSNMQLTMHLCVSVQLCNQVQRVMPFPAFCTCELC